MPSFTISPDRRFHVGDMINCWRRGGGLTPISPTPVIGATVAADSTTTFTGLDFATPYLAGKTVSGPFVQFTTPAAVTLESGVGNDRVLRWSEDDAAYDHPEWWEDTAHPREFVGPTNPAGIDGITLTFADRWTASEDS